MGARRRISSSSLTPPEAITGVRTASTSACGPFDVRAAEHAVFGDVGVDDRRQRQLVGLGGEFQHRLLAVLEPAVRGHHRVAGVETEHDLSLELLGHLAEPLEVADRLGADDDPRHAHVEQLPDRGLVPNAAADLDLEQAQGDDGGDGLGVDGFAGLGAVEVHDVEPPGPVGVELPGLLGRIVAVSDLAVVLALDEPDDLGRLAGRWRESHPY